MSDSLALRAFRSDGGAANHDIASTGSATGFAFGVITIETGIRSLWLSHFEALLAGSLLNSREEHSRLLLTPFPALQNVGVRAALVSAVLFGAGAPAAKLLLGSTSPWLLAGLLYLGSGVGLGLLRLARRTSRVRPAPR